MARRIKKAEAQGIFWLIIIGLPIYGFIQFGEAIGWIPLALASSGVVILYIFYNIIKRNKRRARLMKRYSDTKLVDNLMNGMFWQGQTAEQLWDSLGKPDDLDKKVLKTKKKEIWKYAHQGGNRYALRITLDDDVVVGWENRT